MTASYTVTFRPETPRLVRTLCSYICWQFELVFMCWGGNQDKFIFIAAFPFPILQLFLHLTDITTPSSGTCALPRAAPREGLTFQNLLWSLRWGSPSHQAPAKHQPSTRLQMWADTRQQHSGWPSCGDADKMLTDIHNYSRTTMVFFITVPSSPSPPTPSPRTSHQRGSRFKHSSFTSHDWCGLDRTESQRNWLSGPGLVPGDHKLIFYLAHDRCGQ